jgi:hypothetical protein
MPTKIKSDRRAFINEIGFTLFYNSVHDKKTGFVHNPSPDELTKATEAARDVISRINDDRADCANDPNEDEVGDATEQYKRLWRELTYRTSIDGVIVRPKFFGCGIIDACYGDAIVGGTLFEVKAGERGFRSIDIRQLLTYAALNHISRGYEIRCVGLINPRTGISFEMNLDDVCFEVSGMGAPDMLSKVVQVISSGDISR